MVSFVVQSGPPPPPLFSRASGRALSPIQQTIGSLEIGQWFIAVELTSKQANTQIWNAKARLPGRAFKQYMVEGGPLIMRIA